MRILLDENLNWRLKYDLPGHDVASVPKLGWSGIQNGALLRKAVEAGFEVLITMDSNMVYQQDLSTHPIAVLVLKAGSNRVQDTRPLMPAVLNSLPQIKKGARTLID
jgi:predicted nuclease of predicted toxin-antitoxin system